MTWLVTFICFLTILWFLPSFTTGRIRYYACYTLYTVFASLNALLIAPSACLSPKNPIAISNASKIARFLADPLGITYEIRNQSKLKYGQKAIIVANHQSILDILGLHVLNRLAGTLTVVAAKKLLYFFPWGPSAWLGGLLFLERRNTESAVKVFAEASALLNRQIKIWIFPEGTRNGRSDDFLPFKKGAFHLAIDCQTNIIPLVYSPYYFIDHEKKSFKRGKMIISVLDEIKVEGLTKNDIDDLIKETRQKMREEYERLCLEIKSYASKD